MRKHGLWRVEQYCGLILNIPHVHPSAYLTQQRQRYTYVKQSWHVQRENVIMSQLISKLVCSILRTKFTSLRRSLASASSKSSSSKSLKLQTEKKTQFSDLLFLSFWIQLKWGVLCVWITHCTLNHLRWKAVYSTKTSGIQPAVQSKQQR